MYQIKIKAGREKSLQRRHPWLFSGALQEPKQAPGNGETVSVVSAHGEPLALGAYSPHSQIRVRLWSFDPGVTIDAGFFRMCIARAIQLRKQFVPGNDTACRMINAESDGLPGLIVDRYANYLVCQFLSAGAEFHKGVIIELLEEMLKPAGIYERSDVEVREKEGLSPVSGVLAGFEPPEYIPVRQGDLDFIVDVRQGHKTGMYLDQRDNRTVVQSLAKGKEVLNCFAYTGAFTLAALRGGAKCVTNIESSADAIALINKQAQLNGLGQREIDNIQGDVFTELRKYRDSGRTFDMVILDPPKFVSSVDQLKRGCRGYKDINLLAIKLLREGGILVTFSCSGHLAPELFQKIVADAAVDAGYDVRMLCNLGQPPDHPVALNFPEGRYLKGLVCYRA